MGEVERKGGHRAWRDSVGRFLFKETPLKMSWQATNWVIEHSQHKGSALLTLLCIANCANQDGSDCWPNLERLAKDTRLGKRQLIRIVEALEKSGELEVHHSTGRYPNHYSFPLMNGDKMTPLKTNPTVTFPHGNGDISGTNGDIAMSPDPSIEQSNENHRRLMSVLADREGRIPDGAAQGKAIKWLLQSYSVADCKQCFDFLCKQPWRTSRVSWLTVKSQIGAWKAGKLNGLPTHAEMNAGGRGKLVI
jgi:hypothetical protein